LAPNALEPGPHPREISQDADDDRQDRSNPNKADKAPIQRTRARKAASGGLVLGEVNPCKPFVVLAGDLNGRRCGIGKNKDVLNPRSRLTVEDCFDANRDAEGAQERCKFECDLCVFFEQEDFAMWSGAELTKCTGEASLCGQGERSLGGVGKGSPSQNDNAAPLPVFELGDECCTRRRESARAEEKSASHRGSRAKGYLNFATSTAG
jgi:hypothetical protein